MSDLKLKVKEIEEWLETAEKLSFANIESKRFILSPTGVSEQRDFIGENRSSSFYQEKKFRYEYVCSPKLNIIGVRPVLSCTPVPYTVTLNFKINDIIYTKTWFGHNSNNYFRVITDSRMAPTLEIIDWQQYRCMYRLSHQGEFITRVLGTPDDVLSSLDHYNSFHRTNYSIYQVKIEIE